jgi:tRNA(adenine34) deaminase
MIREDSVFGHDRDQFFMKQALTQAHKAFRLDEVPVGAVVVSPEGKIVGRGHNQVEMRHTQAAHAEVRALAQAGRRLGNWRLEEHWLYVTLEPCAMCMNLAILSRLKGIVFGADSPLFGYRLDKHDPVQLYNYDAICMVKGVMSHEAAQVLKQFFKDKRK